MIRVFRFRERTARRNIVARTERGAIRVVAIGGIAGRKRPRAPARRLFRFSTLARRYHLRGCSG
jgi:hypothetical protein